jgi:hypothetical protein
VLKRRTGVQPRENIRKTQSGSSASGENTRERHAGIRPGISVDEVTDTSCQRAASPNQIRVAGVVDSRAFRGSGRVSIDFRASIDEQCSESVKVSRGRLREFQSAQCTSNSD